MEPIVSGIFLSSIFVLTIVLIICMDETFIEKIKQIVFATIPAVPRDIDSTYILGSTVSIFGPVLVVILTTCLYHHAVEDLGVAVAKLRRIQIALRRLDPLPCSDKYVYWMKSGDDLQRTAQDIKVRYEGCVLNYSERFYLSRKARKELDRANDLLVQGENLLNPQDRLWGRMNLYMKKVIGFIKDMGNDSGLLGIYGTGGVGKSSLLKLVSDSPSEYDNDSFQGMFVHAGTGCTVSQLQEAIATSLGLSTRRNENLQANIIRDHLKDKHFVLLLDDLCEYLDIKAVGIPSPLGTVQISLQEGAVPPKWRKVVFTTRNMDLCDKMGCHGANTIQMKCLDEEDVCRFYHNGGWPDVLRIDAVDTLLLKIPQEEESSSSSRTMGQVARPHLHTVSDAQLQHPQDRLPGMTDYYMKVHRFIEADRAESLLLGICGMRGMGKTTLLRLVRDSYAGNPCFEHIIFVGAGIGSVVNNVQHAIAINLGLDLSIMSSLDEVSRAAHIFDYLEHKSFLLLLDDIMEPINWWAIGLPISPHRQRKIILATRTRAACILMGCRSSNTVEMLRLGNDDAWKLFKGKVGLGIIDDHPQVHRLAKQMVSLCGGLPLALRSLGRAMSNKRDPREWRSAYSQLRAIGLEACEIDEKVGTILFNPTYAWRKDTILSADEQIEARTTIVPGQNRSRPRPESFDFSSLNRPWSRARGYPAPPSLSNSHEYGSPT